MSVTTQDAPLGLRERKKRETRKALHLAALSLVEQRGLDDVTADEIAELAGVSARTFFNYFPTKDAALLGIESDEIARVVDLFEREPAGRPLFDQVQSVVVALFSPDGDDPDIRRRRRRVLLNEPSLAPLMVSHAVQVQAALVECIEARLPESQRPSLMARVLAQAALGAVRAAINCEQHRGPGGDVDATMQAAFALLRDGLGDVSISAE